MALRSLFWKLFPIYLLVILLCVASVATYAAVIVWESFHAETERELLASARLVEERWTQDGALNDPSQLQTLAATSAQAAKARVTLIDASGRVLADSESDPLSMENHAGRPEVREALAGNVGSYTRYSGTLKTDMKYVAVGHKIGPVTVGAVRVARPLGSISLVLDRLYLHITLAGLAVALAAALLALLGVRRVTQPLGQMMRGARRFAQGDFSRKVLVPETAEAAALADALNQMAAELDDKLATLTRQKRQQEAVFACMIEGVLAVDIDGRVITMNLAAGKMLKVDPASATGRALEEVVRSVGVQKFVSEVQSGREPVDREILLPDGEDRTFEARGSILHDAAGRTIGVLVVLNDLTRLNRLETMRRDFVANVSHELKTPVTTIKGFMETLREGGIDDPAKVREFLEAIGRHADRLDELIDDLLSLSRIERDTERHEIQRVPARLKDVLLAAVADAEPRRARQGVRIEMDCPDDLVLPLDAQLMRQAVHNLLDNAIKYSPPDSIVRLSASLVGAEVRIAVRDTGCGIAPEHLDRVFERFYRVDKARSRKLGGTGLGLAIVKHIAQAHEGAVTVESVPDKGSTFTIRLPLK